ncbi:hypothetical protein EZJ49_02660 [Bdellovibrio bacteriovorus]|uniref:hypothetical protein n=1 Tax=Bdellovibrio bacteriovorus TaxID=959 RepID=UPI0021D36C66|nr:hypothetical protein [Bdellovibrio bacteriovorus]UXR65148.1 hypothetical protein EZJ49_02660 [Bdellovibrio bacteriovorus]
MKKLLPLLFLIVSSTAQAGFLLEVGGTYMADTLSTSETRTSTKYFYNLGALFSLKKNIWGGWNYSGISHTDKDTATTTYSSVDTGPYLKWQFGRNQLYSLSMAYNILSKGQFSDGTTTEEWTGTSMWFQFGVMPEVREGLHLGASLNYYLATYSKKTVSGVESNDSNSKSWIFPMLTLTKQW